MALHSACANLPHRSFSSHARVHEELQAETNHSFRYLNHPKSYSLHTEEFHQALCLLGPANGVTSCAKDIDSIYLA